MNLCYNSGQRLILRRAMVFADERPLPSESLDPTPQSQEAEAALLGVSLYDNETFHKISAIIQAKHFYNPGHVRIFDSIARLIESGKLADAISLKNRFSQGKTLRKYLSPSRLQNTITARLLAQYLFTLQRTQEVLFVRRGKLYL